MLKHVVEKQQFVRRRMGRVLPLVGVCAILLASLFVGYPKVGAAGTITGTIFNDLNGSGQRDTSGVNGVPNEPGITAVTVSAFDSTGVQVATTTTAANGTYTLNYAGSETALRVEFGLPAGYQAGPRGAQSATRVQFVTVPATNVNLGLWLPSDYCQNNPNLATSCYVYGDNINGPNKTDPVFVTFPFNAGSATSSGTPTDYDTGTHALMVPASSVGTTYGTAFQRGSKSWFTAAYTKRHAGYGPGGPGAIYRITGTGAGSVSTFIDLNSSTYFGANAVGADPHPASTTNFRFDPTTFDAVGKIGLGDVDLAEDDQTLYTINLATKQLYKIPLGSATSPVAPAKASIGVYLVPSPANCAATTDERPFGLGVYGGKVYVGIVCSAQNTGNTADLRGYVYVFDPTPNTFAATAVLDFPLNYTRRCADGSANTTCTNTAATWQSWSGTFPAANDGDTTVNDKFYARPSPMLTDIVFDDGDMILGLRDRFGDQMGARAGSTNTADEDNYYGITAGDILRACGNPTTGWMLEANATCGGVTTGGANNNQGPANAGNTAKGEFYFHDNLSSSPVIGPSTGINSSGGPHDELAIGSLLQIPGYNEVAASVFDPVPIKEEYFDGGTRLFNNTNGTATRGYRLYNDDFNATLGSFSKANGLGDLAAACQAAPLELGNRVWRDTNGNGIQDPSEAGINQVTVELYRAGTLVGRTTTGLTGFLPGEYVFNTANVNLNGATGLLPNTAYEIRLATAADYATGGSLVGLRLTTADVSTNSKDQIDSDATLLNAANPISAANYPRISITTGTAGVNTHALDIGLFQPASVGDRVWNDANANGIQDGGETGLVAYVALRTAGIDGIVGNNDDTTLDTTTSDGTGAYSFTSLAPGTYYIQFTAPRGYRFSPQTVGGATTATDSNPAANGRTATFTLVDAENNTTIDAGLYQGAAVGDQVWLDVDADGVKDISEPGLPNVTLTLRDSANAAIATTTTNSEGLYLFPAVTPGVAYHVTVDSGVPAGLAVTLNSTGNFTLTAGQTKLDVDFGYKNTSTTTGIVGDYVWFDNDADGIQDPGEHGIGNVTVALKSAGTDGILGTSDDTTGTAVTTAADGSYLITNVAPGEYLVAVTDMNGALTGYTLTSGPQSNPNPTKPITVLAGGAYLEADFGYQKTGLYTLSDVVWYDRDSSGTKDAGEPGLAGVTVRLLDSNGKVIATEVSDTSGTFAFPGLGNGTYTIQLGDTANVLMGFSGTTVPGQAYQIGVTIAGANVAGVNFGYNTPGAIGDTVWSDADGDKTQNPGEPGIGGVVVTLYRDSNSNGTLEIGTDTLVGTKTTNAAGFYLFPNLSAGTYFASVDTAQAALTGYTATTVDQQTTATGLQLNAVLALGTNGSNSILDADFGFQKGTLPNVSGTVWFDPNTNARIDSTETGRAVGVTIALVNSSGVVVATTTTDASGNYSFADVAVGDYTVQVTDTAGILQGFTLTTSTDLYPITVAAADITNINFGYSRSVNTGSIGDYVWLDADRDGVQDAGENGIANVTLKLYTSANTTKGDGDDVLIGTTKTDVNGRYLFGNLPPNTLYFVDVDQTTLPNGGTGLTLSPGVGDPANSGTTDPSKFINLSAGENFRQADFPFVPSANSVIGDRVWYDADGDQVQDPGEVGIGGVQVTVTGTGLGAGVTVTTDPDGSWLVTGLQAGNIYTVVVTPPAGYNATPTNGPVSRTYTAVANQDILYADFGFNGNAVNLGSIGDTVFFDANNDGVKQAGETGFAGVTLNLLNSAGTTVLATATTDNNGVYKFSGLPFASYQIQLTDLNGVLAGLSKTSGTANTNDNSQALPFPVTLNSTTPNVLYADFGYTGAGTGVGSIGNLVWHDLNNNGVWVLGEPGIQGVTVDLYRDNNANGTLELGDNLVRTTTSDRNGAYEFSGLPADKYLVKVTDTAGVLSGFTKTTGTAGSDNNSQAIPYAITLSSAAPNNYTADFGYRATTPYTLSGTVFNDTSTTKGTFDSGEPTYQNAVIELYRDLNNNGVLDPGEPSLGTATTNASGLYTFTDLPNGNYIVVVSQRTAQFNGAYQTTQTTTRSVQPATINNANSVNNNFGFTGFNAPTVTGGLSLAAEAQADTVVIRWETLSEYNLSGFHVYRGTDFANATRLTTDLVPAEGSGAAGATYTWTDRDVAAGTTYTYWVEAIDNGGVGKPYGPVMVTLAAPNGPTTGPAITNNHVFLPFVGK